MSVVSAIKVYVQIFFHLSMQFKCFSGYVINDLTVIMALTGMICDVGISEDRF